MHRGCFVWTPTPPLAGRKAPRPGPARVCVCLLFLAGSDGPASRARSGAPHLFLWPLCLSALLGPVRAGVAPVLVLCLPSRPPFAFFFRFSVVVFLAPPLSPAFSGFRPWVPWALALCVVCFVALVLLGSPCALASLVLPGRRLLSGGCPPPPPFCVSLLLPPHGAWLSFFFLPLCAPVVSGFLWFPAPGALGLCAVFCLFYGPPAARLSARSRLVCVSRCSVPSFFLFFFLRCAPLLSLAFFGFRPRLSWASALCAVCFVGLLAPLCALASFVLSAWPLAAPWPLLPPPPPLCLAVSVAAARCCVPCAVLCCVSLGAVRRRAAARCAARCCAVVCCVALLRSFGAAACCALPSGIARRPGALCSAALCFAVFPRAVSSVLCVFCRGVVVRAVVRRSALCCVCPGVLCCAFPVLSALCGAVLRCAGALALCCSCGACCCWRLVLWCAAVCCAVSFGVLWCSVGSGGPWLSAEGVFRCRCPCLAAWSASLDITVTNKNCTACMCSKKCHFSSKRGQNWPFYGQKFSLLASDKQFKTTPPPLPYIHTSDPLYKRQNGGAENSLRATMKG